MCQPPLQELMKDIPSEKLQLPCNDKDLCTLALYISDWKELLPFLKLEDSDEKEIEEKYKSVKRRRVAALRKWREKYAEKATYEKLSEAFWNIGRSDLVEKVCQRFVKETAESSAEEEWPDEDIGGTVPQTELLKLPCKCEHLRKLATSIADWKEIAPFLGLEDVDENMIEEMHKSPIKRRIATLRKWQEKNENKATYGRLAKALRKIGKANLVSRLYTEICTASETFEEEKSNREPSAKCQKLLYDDKNLSLTSLVKSANPCTHDPKCREYGDHIPSSVTLIAFIPPNDFEDVERMFHQLVLSGHSDCINAKARTLVECKDIDPSIRVLALGFQALEYTHSENDPQYALVLLEKAMSVIETEMTSNNSVIMKARIHRHYTIAFRKQGKLDEALRHIQFAKKLYLTSQAPPYDYANLLCEHAAILEMKHKEDMHGSVKEEIGNLWEGGVHHIVLSKDYQFPTVVFVVCARQAMFHMKAWSGTSQSKLSQPNPQNLAKAEKCLQQCAEIKTSHHQPSGYKVTFNLAYSYIRFWQGNLTEALAYTKSALRHYEDCQRKSERTAATIYGRLQWLQSRIPDQMPLSGKDTLIQVLN